MFVKKFEAPSLEQALAQVKQEMGPNALILSTQQKGGKWFQKSLVTVTAAFEKRSREELQEHFDEEELRQVFPHRKLSTPNIEEKAKRSLKQLEDSAAKAEIKISSPVVNTLSPSVFEKDFLVLGFSPDSAREISRRLVFDYPKKDLSNPSFLEKTKAKLVAHHMHTISPEIFHAKSCWAVVGMPGVGKTSLLVKLALFLRKQSRKSMLISLDGRKVVGRSELAAYAKLLDLPFSHETHPAWSEAQGIQLVDTPSLNFQSESESMEIEKMCRNRNTVLVLDAAARLSELLRIIELSKRFAPTAVAFTRLDAVMEPGVIYDVLKTSRLPLLGVSIGSSLNGGTLKFFESLELAQYLLKPETVKLQPSLEN